MALLDVAQVLGVLLDAGVDDLHGLRVEAQDLRPGTDVELDRIRLEGHRVEIAGDLAWPGLVAVGAKARLRRPGCWRSRGGRRLGHDGLRREDQREGKG
jgi:hypothetical protein